MSATEHNAAYRKWDGKYAAKIRSNAAEIQAILDATDGTDPFRAIDVATLSKSGRDTTLELLRSCGAVERTHRETVDRREDDRYQETNGRGKLLRNVYRWRHEARVEIAAMLDAMDTFPCGHGVHIFNPRGSDEDTLACRECGREYSKDFVRGLL